MVNILYTIRNATPEDVPAINEIVNYYIASTNVSLALEQNTIRQTQDWFDSHMGIYPVIVAEVEGEVVGYASLSKFRAFGGYDKTAENSVYLKDKIRRNGIGLSLLLRLLELGKEMGFHCVVGVINNENIPSIALHEKAGFQINGVIREVGHKKGVYVDIVFMSIVL